MRYGFISMQKKAFGVRRACELLQVGPSGYYAYVGQGGRRIPGDEVMLITRVREIHAQAKGAYGSRRMAERLQGMGYRVGRYRARSLMLKAGVSVKRSKRFRVTTDSRHCHPVASNLLNRQFDINGPDKVWASDITYLWTKEGWLYLAVVMDIYSRKIVGWATSNRITADLAARALRVALGKRRPEAELIHHSDQGIQYACPAYQQMLAANGVIPSMSRKGDCWDNAVVESFFGTLKNERTHHQRYATREEAYRDIFDYIEIFYNRIRLHSYLGYVSPDHFERRTIVA